MNKLLIWTTLPHGKSSIKTSEINQTFLENHHGLWKETFNICVFGYAFQRRRQAL